MRRVLQLTPSYPPTNGGIEDHVWNLSSKLPEYGYEPLVLTPHRGGTVDEGSVYYEPTFLTVKKSAFAPTIVSRLLELDYDILHAHAPFHFGLEFAALAAAVGKVPLVVTAHMYDARDSFLYGAYESLIYDRCLDRADRILPTTWDYVAGYEVFERNRERTVPIPMSVDTDRYRPVPRARERLGWAENERVVLFVGAMERHHFYKNVDLLVEAFARTDAADRLVLVGSGDRVPELKRRADAEGVRESVEFAGYVPEEDLPTYYTAADVSVLPSKADRGEAFGIVLLEAMACGTPVVGTDIPGVRTAVGDGGVIVPPQDGDALREGIKAVLTDPNAYAPRKRVERDYSLERVAESIVDVYGSVL
jgi:glycosyltransferase involved in cell wall biosynthesis